MHYILSLLILSILPLTLQGQSSLTVNIANVRSMDGTVYVALHNNGTDFPNQEPIKTLQSAAESGEVTVVFEGLTSGEYALTVFHDVNNNSELDKNVIGIPKEPFGFSNDEMGMFGPPSFEKCIVPVKEDENVTTTVTLKEM